MKKITLFLMSLFLTVGAMAQTLFSEPQVGKLYKIKGDHQSLCWMTDEIDSGSNAIKVSSNEADAAIFKKTENGFQVVSTGKYLGMVGKVISYVDNEATVTLHNTGSQNNTDGKYAIKVANNWWYNNSTNENPVTHESTDWLNTIERFWGFIEVNNGPLLEIDDLSGLTKSYPYKLSDGDASKIFDLKNMTIVVNATLPSTLSDRRAFVCFADPDQPKASGGTTTNTPYCGFGINGSYAGYLASSLDTDRFTAGVDGVITASKRLVFVYKIDVTKNRITVIADNRVMYEATYPQKGYQMPNIKNLKENYENANIYIGGGKTAAGNQDVFAGRINAVHFYNGILDDSEIATATARINSGKYLRIKRKSSTNNSYLLSTGTAGNKVSFSTSGDYENTILYYNQNDKSLLSYKSGLFFKNANGDRLSYSANIGDQKTTAYIQKNGDYYAVEMCINNRFMYSGNDNGVIDGGTFANGITTINNNNYKFAIEEVTSLPVTITDAKYATFYAPVAVKVPAGVTAHTVTINGEWATLSEALEVIPANTGVVLYSETADTYDFAITDDVEAIEGNALLGSVAATYYTAAGTYYALGVVDGVTAFYKDKFNNNHFQNNSHKAYLYVEGTNPTALSTSLRFDFDGNTTAIEEVETKAAETVIYDLTGRRVNEITKSGVYIIGGKKILVK